MKVIHLISGGDSGGAKTHVLSLLQNLNRSITARMVCFRDGPFADEARALGIPTDIMSGNVSTVRQQLLRHIRQEGYQVIHCHGARANMMGALLRRELNVPVVTTVHSDYRLDYMGRPLSHLTFGTINALALRQLDYYIGVSDAMVDLLISRNFPPDRFFPLYNGVDFTPGIPVADRLAYLRSLGLDVDENSVVVGIAARMNPVKDMSTLIRGFAAAYANCARLRLIIAGDGEEREKLTALIKELGVEKAVCLAGWITGSMDDFYSALDINALTSLSETFPYALTEGARWQLATVATAVGGIPYLIDPGVNGFLFSPGDHQALGRILTNLAQDDDLRRSLGQRLYQKASTRFSLQNTVDTQIRIYESIIRRHSRPRQKRDGVVICGSYGRSNAGDDAILQAILNEIRSIDPDIPMTVISKNPKETRLTYRVRSVSRTDILAWRHAMNRARLYINGGGSLIQDITSRRSLWYYLYNIRTAKQLGCRVQMYGCGIGPVQRQSLRKLSAKVLNRYVDVITLREPDSLKELQDMKVTTPRIQLTADPALTLAPASDDVIDSAMLAAGLPTGGKYICFTLRNWKGFEEKSALFARAAEHAWNTYGLTPVFLSIERQQDPAAAALAASTIQVPHHFMQDNGHAETLIGILSRMQAVVSMRLHALVFAAGQGTPLVGIVYDPKVSSFLRYIGQDIFENLEDLTEESLCRMIDRCLERKENPGSQAETVRRLTELEQGNVTIARELMEL